MGITRAFACSSNSGFPILVWLGRGGRADYGGGLENRFRASERGFESHPLRSAAKIVAVFFEPEHCLNQGDGDEDPRVSGKGTAGGVRYPGT